MRGPENPVMVRVMVASVSRTCVRDWMTVNCELSTFIASAADPWCSESRWAASSTGEGLAVTPAGYGSTAGLNRQPDGDVQCGSSWDCRRRRAFLDQAQETAMRSHLSPILVL